MFMHTLYRYPTFRPSSRAPPGGLDSDGLCALLHLANEPGTYMPCNVLVAGVLASRTAFPVGRALQMAVAPTPARREAQWLSVKLFAMIGLREKGVCAGAETPKT